MKNSLASNMIAFFIISIAGGVLVFCIWGTDQLIRKKYYIKACEQYAKTHNSTFIDLAGKSHLFVPVSASFKTNSVNGNTFSVPIDEILGLGPGKTIKNLHNPIIIIAILISIFLWYMITMKSFNKFIYKKNRTNFFEKESDSDELISKTENEYDIELKQALIKTIVNRFKDKSAIDLNNDENAIARIKDYVRRNYPSFTNESKLEINIPYICADRKCTYHLQDTIYRKDVLE